ncbi:YacL family protein [Shewanella chilikensis]|uniref:UPF0231 family protein n=1 Tax=Shewanella chilikensis TaxID=558541 RepID=UPI0030CEC5D6
MEYEFRRNSLTGTAMARFSMEHHVLGQWFSEELADNAEICTQVKQALADLQSGRIREWQLIGRDLTLQLEQEQVRVYANVLEFGESQELDESLSLYDAESEAWCGLEDFQDVLESWCDFLHQSR